jgi:hypothetical protein
MARPIGAVALGGALLAGLVAAVPSAAAPAEKIGYCHRTDAETNPYVFHQTDPDSIVKAGHGQHTGPIFPKTGPDGKWGDIIPPFTYSGGTFPGLNWNPLGETVVAAGCVVDIGPIPPLPTPTTSTTVPESTTTDTFATTTTAPIAPPTAPTTSTNPPQTSTSAPESTSSTTIAGATTTVTLAGEPTDIVTPPPLIDPGPGVDIMPPLRAYVLVRHTSIVLTPSSHIVVVHRIVVLGPLSIAERTKIKAFLDRHTMAFTGHDTERLVLFALVFMLAGAALLGGGWRRRRHEP